MSIYYVYAVNPFQADVAFLYPLKILENHGYSDVFRGFQGV